MKNISRLIVLFFFIFFSYTAFTQGWLKPGFIVKQDNDTLFGRIYDGGEILNGKVCHFKSGEIRGIKTYRPNEIKAYKIGNNKLYESGENEKGKQCFLEVLLQGEIDLLHQWNGKKVHYYIRKQGQKRVQLSNDYVKLTPRSEFSNIKITTTSNYYHNLDLYKDSLYFFFDKSRSILPELVELEYDKKSLISISKTYLHATCKQPNCITYEKDLRQQRDRFGFYSGLTESVFTVTVPAEYDDNNVLIMPAFDVLAPATSVPVGIFYSIPLKTISDRLFFQPEFSYARSDHSSIENTITGPKEISVHKETLALPLLFKYQLPIGKFKPAIAAGWEIRYILDYDVPIEDVKVERRLEPGRWVAHAEIAYPLTKKTDIFARVKLHAKQRTKEESDMPVRESTVSPFYDKAQINGSFHVGISF